jgi:UDP-N-acetylglucosamine acyltransferase
MEGYKLDAKGNKIHYSAIIEPWVEIGWENHIGPFCLIGGRAIIGSRNRFESHCVVGCIPDVHGYTKEEISSIPVMIGDDNYFSQFVTVSSGTYRWTKIGHNCLLQKCTHVGHDVIVGNFCTLSVGATLGGDSVVEDFVNFGLGVLTHPQTVQKIGCIYGMNSTVTKKTEERAFSKFVGSPAKYLGENTKARDVYDSIILGKEPTEYARRFLGDVKFLTQLREEKTRG